MSLSQILEKQRSVAVETVVREQFESELRALTDAEQDSKELKSAKRHLLFERIIENVQLPFPVGPAAVDGEPVVKDTLTKSYVKKACESIYKSLVREKIAVQKIRPDGRTATQIRPIEVEVGVMPRTHGSGLFTRGQTQIMSLLTLGTAKEGQRIDDLSLETDRRFMHHYNFPPYSVGETGRMGSPKRRDIGHGALAQRALEAVIPPAEDFPYTIRIVSETLESNGSSSMGSVCGSTLALMDAGVPIASPVSGIAMGLVKEGDAYEILTDIQGAEDHLGDMDFKVAGTREGITALQMDIKITGVSREIMQRALAQAKDARIAILGAMEAAIAAPREALAEHAPRISTIQINPEFIGMVIGKGGETIRSLESEYDVQIDIEEDGTILVYATEGTKGDAAIEAIRNLTKEPEVGDTYTGRVVKTTDFGAFVELKKGTDGLLHVSNVGPGRVNHIEDVIARGDTLDVIVQEVDKARGRIGLKLVQKHEGDRMVSPEELVERAKDAPPREPREDRPRRDGDRRGGRGGRPPRARGVARRVARAGSSVRRREAARHDHRRRGRPPPVPGGRPRRRAFHDARPARPAVAEHAGAAGRPRLRVAAARRPQRPPHGRPLRLHRHRGGRRGRRARRGDRVAPPPRQLRDRLPRGRGGPRARPDDAGGRTPLRHALRRGRRAARAAHASGQRALAAARRALRLPAGGARAASRSGSTAAAPTRSSGRSCRATCADDWCLALVPLFIRRALIVVPGTRPALPSRRAGLAADRARLG